MAGVQPSRVEVLERGDLFFLYRPDVEEFPPHGLLDVRRFYMVLRPQGKDRLRLLAIGKKKLPGAGEAGQRHWGFVAQVAREPEQLREELGGTTEARPERPLAWARPAGEGVYALVRHGNHTHLAYVLGLPERLGEVQRAFNIAHEGRFVLAIKNPEAASPVGVGLDEGQQADFPDHLKAKFGDRRWLAVDPPAFLDYAGAEVVLIGGRDDLGTDLGLDLPPPPEDESRAEVFKDLHLEKSERTIRPLFEGTWE